MCMNSKDFKSAGMRSKKGSLRVCNKVTRAQDRQKLRTERLKAERDFASQWLDKLLKTHIKDLDKLSRLEKHLILLEESALQTLVAALNARVRFSEVQSRDLNGEVLHETPVLELEFIRGPKYFARKKPALINLKKVK